MKLFRLSLAISLVALTITSCKKDEVAKTTSNQVKNYTEDVTSIVAGHSTTTYNIAYDAGGRLSSIISSANAGDKFLYNYISSSKFTTDIYSSNVLTVHVDYFLNSLPFVDSSFQFNNTGDTTSEKYVYNSSRQLVSLKSFSYTAATGPVLDETHTFLYDANGNQVKDSDGFTVSSFDYSSTVNNNPLQQPYLPVSPNLVQKTTEVSGGITTTINHTYTFDSNGRMITEKEVANNGDVVLKTYTY